MSSNPGLNERHTIQADYQIFTLGGPKIRFSTEEGIARVDTPHSFPFWERCISGLAPNFRGDPEVLPDIA